MQAFSIEGPISRSDGVCVKFTIKETLVLPISSLSASARPSSTRLSAPRMSVTVFIGLPASLLSAVLRSDLMRVRTNAPVERILVDGGEVVGVRSVGRDISCRFVVNAAGPWCNDLLRPLGLELPVQVWQRQIFVTTPHPDIPADRPIYVDVTGRFYFRQELDGGFVLGLVKDIAAKELANPETDWEFRTRAVEAAVHRVPKLAETGIANAWSGNVTFTPDQLPVLGPVPSVKGLLLANGMSGYGVMISPAVGLAVAEMIALGRSKTLDVSTLTVDRFRGAQKSMSGGLWLSSGNR